MADHRNRFLPALVASAVCLLSCGGDLPCRENADPPSDARPASPPLAWFETSDHRVVVYPSSEWTKLVNLSLFEGFSPGMSYKEARASLGEADLYFEETMAKHWVYIRPRGKVSVADVDMSSPPLVLFPRSWILFGFPENGTLESFFHPEVLKHLPLGQPTLELTIMNNCGYPGIQASIQEGKLKRMSWHSTPGSLPK